MLQILMLLSLFVSADDQKLSAGQIDALDTKITLAQEQMQMDKSQAVWVERWRLRSKHFVFGMPELTDDRHEGVSMLVREGFVVGHFDKMRSPLWVCQRWTKADYYRMNNVKPQSRRWKLDLELPRYARAKGTSYDGNRTKMDRGHMARHAMNRAWGVDNSNAGCLMSNSTPQHKDVNRGPGWRELEDQTVSVVIDEDFDIQAVWIVSGAIFPEQDIGSVGDGYCVPVATFKIVGWFDDQKWFQVRGYLFGQSDRMPEPEDYLVPVDKIEARTGLDFFPFLRDDVEKQIEAAQPDDLWGAE